MVTVSICEADKTLVLEDEDEPPAARPEDEGDDDGEEEEGARMAKWSSWNSAWMLLCTRVTLRSFVMRCLMSGRCSDRSWKSTHLSTSVWMFPSVYK